MGHGGPNPGRGFYGHGTIVSGKNSNFPLIRLAGKYKEMGTDVQLLSQRKSIQIVRYRIGQLLERIDLDDAPDRLKRLGKLWDKFKKVRYTDELEMIKVQKALDEEFEAAFHDYAIWSQMFEALDLEKNLVESEVRIIKDLKAIMTAEDAYQMVAKIFAIIMQVEEDPKKIKRFQYEFTQLIGEGKMLDAEWTEEAGVDDA